jgi:hypothetical protein
MHAEIFQQQFGELVVVFNDEQMRFVGLSRTHDQI